MLQLGVAKYLAGGFAAGFLSPCKASKRSNALCLASFDNEAGRQKDKAKLQVII